MSEACRANHRRVSRHLGVYLGTVAVPVAVAVLAIVELADGGLGTAPAVGGSGLVVYRLLVATGVVVGLAALGGLLARKLRQPEVVGQMAAGILLGPSVFGALLPGAQRWLFAPAVLPYLDALAQFGVVFFMFGVGTELAPGSLRRGGPRALTIGHASIAVPFLAGVAVAWLIRGGYQPDGRATMPFLLFVGVSFAITAFPVLASILADRGLLRTPLGATAMTAAGIGDVTAWCLLAVVIALVRGTAVTRALLAVALTVVFVLIMVGLVRPLLARVVPRAPLPASQVPPPAGLAASRATAMAGLVCLVLAAAVATDWIGVHAIFGAFLAGVVMPRNCAVVAELIVKIEGITLWLMLPLFFASVGMRTALGSLSGAAQWLLCLVVVLVAVVGKMAGAGLAARATGGSTRESLALGAMMSCRGLTELIVLNLGLQLGVMRPELFVMFVVMALLTTAMTGPLLRLVLGRGAPVAVAGVELAVMKGR